jgi:hypothetical protein
LKKKQIDEYEAETDRMKRSLDGLGFGPVENLTLEDEALENLVTNCKLIFGRIL